MGVPTAMRANFWRSGGAGNVDCRIYDVTNGNQICIASTPGTSGAIFTNLGALASLPAAPATFEVQIRAPGAGQCRIGGVIVEY
jgi:hypothetical protein